jgi:RHS repeat-associated protein
MYDEKGQLVWETHLDIYGKVRTFAGRSLSDCPFRYQGQYEDSETGLYYNRFRYYSPEEGMYLSQDPIRLAGNNPTLYGYVHDTNSWLDEFGLMPSWMPAKQGYQRHHIIPQSLKNHPVIEASGINLDSASNMKYLPVAEGIDLNPNKSLHNGWNEVHSDYNMTMTKRLDDLYNQAELEGWSKDKRRMQVEVTNLQRRTRRELDNGNLKCH